MRSTSSTGTIQHPARAATQAPPRRFPSTKQAPWRHGLIVAGYTLPLGFVSVYGFLIGMYLLGPLVYALLAAPLLWLKPLDRKYAGVKGSWGRSLIVALLFWLATYSAWQAFWTGGEYDHELMLVIATGMVAVLVGILATRLLPSYAQRARTSSTAG